MNELEMHNTEDKPKKRFDTTKSISVGTFVMMFFFISWLLAATFYNYDILDYDYPESFVPVTVEQQQAFSTAKSANEKLEFSEFMASQGNAIFYEEDIVQFRLKFNKKYATPTKMNVVLVPHFIGGTYTNYIERSGNAPIGLNEGFLLTEQIRPGTIPGKYSMIITYTFTKPIGGIQIYTVNTKEFEIRAK